ncbi:MAG: sarcinarray family MAST domain-containing protein [Thermoplasmata archaeon]|nr:sarcinarray family MAST domain-containing protein [Thermoplasmata archaeon]
MIRTMVVVYFIVLLFLTHMILVHTAGECNYGSVHAWFRTSDGEWENATAHPWLKRGESFEIKTVVTAKADLQVFFVKLHEFGTPVFEVVEGPTMMEQLLECRQNILSDQTFTYVWKMRVRSDTTWVNGYGPLEVFTQFNKNDTDEYRMDFDVITAFIVDELWESYTQENTCENFSSQNIHSIKLPGFEVGGMFIVVFVLCIFIRLRK